MDVNHSILSAPSLGVALHSINMKRLVSSVLLLGFLCPSSSFAPPRRLSRPSTHATLSTAASPAVPVSIGVLALVQYHRNLQKREDQGESTWRTAQADTRADWASHVRETSGWLYAVQTLRNAITANTFLATTVLSLLTVITGKLWTTSVQGTLYQRL